MVFNDVEAFRTLEARQPEDRRPGMTIAVASITRKTHPRMMKSFRTMAASLD
jgi:hypothetical protein